MTMILHSNHQFRQWTDSVMDSILYQNTDDDSDNGKLHDKPTGTSDDDEEEEQFDFDEWFAEQMNNFENGSEKSTSKEDNLWFLGQHH